MKNKKNNELMEIICLTEEAYYFLKEQEEKQGISMGKIVCALVIKKYGRKINEDKTEDEIAEFINLFKTINPTINFGNKTTRKAAKDLISQFGKEKAIEYALYAIGVFGKPYAPVITTPYELREKLSKLAAFNATEKNKSIIIKVAPAYKQ